MATVTLYRTFDLSAFDFTAFADGHYYGRQQNFVNISDPVDGGLTDYYTAIGPLKFGDDGSVPVGGAIIGLVSGYRVTGETPFTNETYFQQLDSVSIVRLMKAGATDTLKDDARLLADMLKGDDFLTGSEGADTLTGFAGDDHFDGRGGGDAFLGGKGSDTLSYAQATSGVKIDLAGGKASGGFARHDTFASIENVDGGAFKDRIVGTDGANMLDGHGGSDTLAGGGGADVFLFTTGFDTAGVDRIDDFAVGEDKIGLRYDPFGGLLTFGGKLPARYFTQGVVARTEDNLLIYDEKTGNLFYDPDGTGSLAQTLFARLDDHLDLSIKDFIVA